VEAMWIEEHRRHIAGRLGVPTSTVHAVLVRCRINAPRPTANRKIHRTLADGCAYTRFYESTHHRNAPYPTGSTSTIITDPTAQSAPSHPSPD
jgi:hypothetical protein